MWWLAGALAHAQTTDQSEHSLYYLERRACIDDTGPAPVYSPLTPQYCEHDSDCAAPATCLHRSRIDGAQAFYPPLAHPPAPSGGIGASITRYIPLCEDGSGDHEWSVSGGALGRAPTCLSEDYIRCADGTRPRMHLSRGTTGNWLVFAGAGGYTTSPGMALVGTLWESVMLVDRGAYGAPVQPVLRRREDGIFAAGATNPFSAWNRVDVEKCTPDGWSGNADVEGLTDYTNDGYTETSYEAYCYDVDGDGEGTCADDDVLRGACPCFGESLAPPPSPNHEYSVYFHGRRILRSALADLASGPVAYTSYPLVDDGTGQARVQAGDVSFPAPTLASRMVFACHSLGCVFLESGGIDEVDAGIDAALGGDVDVRVILQSRFAHGLHTEASISEWDGTDADGDGFPDAPGVIDDAISVYDEVVDPVSITGQPVSDSAIRPGGLLTRGLEDFYQPEPGYPPPGDATCLAHHCPGTTDWSADLACSPCRDPHHVLLNHLQTPFLLLSSQLDDQLSMQCTDAADRAVACDWRGVLTDVDVVDSHYRQGIRKVLADLYRYGATERCEAASGPAPYDRMMILSPDWTRHLNLLEVPSAGYTLDLGGPTPRASLAQAAWRFVTAPRTATTKVLCLEERTAGENAATFGAGAVPVCD
jgi:hypothetical protein